MSLLLSRRPISDTPQLNRMLDQAFNAWPFATTEPAPGWMPLTDVFEDAHGLRIVTEVPGMTAEDLKITFENRQLTIQGEKRQMAEESTRKVHRYERSYGSFERRFALPDSFDPDKIEATVEHGLLTIALPFAEQRRPRAIAITSKT
jgi:HSP20 family protein